MKDPRMIFFNGLGPINEFSIVLNCSSEEFVNCLKQTFESHDDYFKFIETPGDATQKRI